MYINSFCSISPAGVITPETNTSELLPNGATIANCVEPEYSNLIPIMQLRRMSKPVRTGVAAAKLCLQHIDNAMPKSIHVGTTYGMLQDSENFLKNIIEQEEEMLNPTAFIQSTHNTVGGQIALSLGCNAHNMTFAHKGHSFESALLDAKLQLARLNDNENTLLGAVDEITATSYKILERFGVYNENNCAGEGATFFSISKNKIPESIVHIDFLELLKANNRAAIENNIQSFILKNELQISDDDLFLNGLEDENSISLFHKTTTIFYQQYSGKYATAAAFGLAFALLKIKEGTTKRCWLLNGFGKHYSLILVSKV